MGEYELGLISQAVCGWVWGRFKILKSNILAVQIFQKLQNQGEEDEDDRKKVKCYDVRTPVTKTTVNHGYDRNPIRRTFS